MAYLVRLRDRAERDLAAVYAAIHAEHSDTAMKLYRRLKEAILSLEEYPNRCQRTRSCGILLYGKKPHTFRAIYRVLEKQKQVEVLHIRHGARDDFPRVRYCPDELALLVKRLRDGEPDVRGLRVSK